MHAKSGGSSGEPPDFLFIPAACRSRKDLPRSAGGETGRRTRATGRGQQNTGNAGTGRRRRGCGATGTERRAAGPRVRVRVRVRDAEHGTRNTEDAGVGRGTQNAERGTRKTWTRARARGAGDGRRGTGDGAQAPVHGTQRDRIRPARPRNNLPGPFTAGRHPPRAAPYLSRVRIRITPLPPRTPYMLLPRCTSTDLTS